MTDAYIYDAIRTPRGKGRKDGSLHELTALRLSADTLNALKTRNGIEGHVIEDVIWGNATQVAEQGGCLARSAVLMSDLDERIPGLSINRFCASGMEAVNIAANQVRGGGGEAYIAGGVEMMSRVPMGSDGAAIAVDPELAMKTYFVPQGISADIIATEYGFSRDDVDALAVQSQKRANAAWQDGRFAGSVIAISRMPPARSSVRRQAAVMPWPPPRPIPSGCPMVETRISSRETAGCRALTSAIDALGPCAVVAILYKE